MIPGHRIKIKIICKRLAGRTFYPHRPVFFGGLIMNTKKLFILSAILVLGIAVFVLLKGSGTGIVSANAAQPVDPAVAAPSKTLKAFHSEEEMKTFLAGLKKKAVERNKSTSNAATPMTTDSVAQPEAKAAAPTKDDKEESITNNQHAGVDEGGIVKLRGEYLVVLRRGRLFTVKVGTGDLKPVSVADAFGGEIDPNGTWYDEMLISGNTVAVIGYSYSRGGTEVGLFNLDDAGKLTYRSTYHLRSNDYYSSRNYASRMIGNKLVFYAPFYMSPYTEDPTAYFPAVRRWHKGARTDEFKRIIPATNVYNGMRNAESMNQLALHTVTACDIDGGEMNCKATGVMGPPGNVFYVSGKSVYVWASDWYGSGQGSMLYNMPLDGSSPSALGVTGSPVDQFSFLESNDGMLNVLVRANATGTGMWNSEVSSGDVALMSIKTDSFGDVTTNVAESSYRSLPKPTGYTFQNRFVGDYLLYGTGSGWGETDKGKGSTLYVVKRSGGDVRELALQHGVDRIEALGTNAIIVGTSGNDLNFTSVRLRRESKIVDVKVMKNASQGELRSHGFFYKAEDDDSGILGLPVSQSGRAGYEHLFNGSASIQFFRNESLHLNELGKLSSRTKRAVNDNCRASCVDWYGNARPIFAKGRVFALLGYEIVEGEMDEDGIYEIRRTDFTPGRMKNTARGEEE